MEDLPPALAAYQKFLGLLRSFCIIKEIDRDESAMNAKWLQLHERNAPKLYNLFQQLGGIYVKVAQVLASRPDFTHKIYRQYLVKLLDGTLPPSIPFACDSIETYLQSISNNFSINEVFSEFDVIPLGSASIATVYSGKIKGEHLNSPEDIPVAVKIQLPGRLEQTRIDLNNIGLATWIFNPNRSKMHEKISGVVLNEFDFEKEREYQQAVRELLLQHVELCGSISIPRIYAKFSTPKMITMERVEGISMEQYISDKLHRVYTLGVKYMMAKEKWELGDKKEQPPKRPTGKILGILATFTELCELLYRFYGAMVLQHQKFHSDPHLGNIVISETEYKEPKLHILDFGMCDTISDKTREKVKQMILALDSNDRDRIIKAARKCGYRSTYDYDETIYCLAVLNWDSTNFSNLTEYRNYMKQLKLDPMIEFPEDTMLVYRIVLLLGGMCRKMFLQKDIFQDVCDSLGFVPNNGVEHNEEILKLFERMAPKSIFKIWKEYL